MGIINILDAQTANMIAAGEVVERPASVVKELIENSLDAGADEIFIEIRDGGRSYIRVTDNGSGISRDDIPKALLRHATSKIKTGGDLDGIATLGFRGEALASIGAVGKIEIISRRRDSEQGSRLSGGGGGLQIEDAGCPAGTTVIVKELFHNVPARRKFLKKDPAEAAAVCAAAENAALSSPGVRFAFISDGEKKFFTTGDGKLKSAVFSVYGLTYASGLEEVEYESDGIKLYGFVTKPENARGSRSMQSFFVNGRFIRSKTIAAAIDEAYKSHTAFKKYPGAVLTLLIDPKSTDVNVHPAKLEIKFSDERKIFEAVYYGLKNMLEGKAQTARTAAELSGLNAYKLPARQFVPEKKADGSVAGYEVFKTDLGGDDVDPLKKFDSDTVTLRSPEPEKEIQTGPETFIAQDEIFFKIIGEAYNAYIFAELADKILIIDKHAAHERILYGELAERKENMSQFLLESVPVTLGTAQTELICGKKDYLRGYGFELEPFGKDTVLIRAVPAVFAEKGDAAVFLQTLADGLAGGDNIPFEERCDRALFTAACKAAVKAGQRNDAAHSRWIVEKLLTNEKIKRCPHGRPVCREITKREVEKFFGR